MKNAAVGVGAALLAGALLLRAPAPIRAPASPQPILQAFLRHARFDQRSIDELARALKVKPSQALVMALYAKDAANRSLRK